MNFVKKIHGKLKNGAPIILITCAMISLNIGFFIIGKLGIGSDILGYMSEAGRFDDFYNLFPFAPTIPNPDSPIQYTALAIILGRLLSHHQMAALILILVIGIFLPIFLIRRNIFKYFDKNSLFYLIFIITSYPILFAFSRGNPTIIGALWSIAGVLAFVSGETFISKSSFFIGSLFHPAPAIFSLLFLKNGLASFAKMIMLIFIAQLSLYTALGKPLLATMADIAMSLEKYKADYVIGGGGDLYNNSLFFIFKIAFIDNMPVINFALQLIPLFIFAVLFIKTYAAYKSYGKNSAFYIFGLYLLPIALVISSPVSADYRLAYLLIPVILMLLTRSFGLPLFLLLAALLPKHFIFFSSYWLSMHPDATLVYPDLIKTVGITINSFLTPPILLFCLFITNASIMKFIHKLSNVSVNNVR
jgi:hypothetical protein